MELEVVVLVVTEVWYNNIFGDCASYAGGGAGGNNNSNTPTGGAGGGGRGGGSTQTAQSGTATQVVVQGFL